MRALAALLVFSFLVAACDSAGVVPDSEPVVSDLASVALPLAVGNEWTYRVVSTNYPMGGTPEPPDTTGATVRVTGTVVIEGETWYAVTSTGQARLIFPSLLANRPDGLYARGVFSGTGYTPAVKRAAYPAAVGTQFGIAHWLGGVEGAPGVESDQDVTLKRVDLPFRVGGVEYEGYFFTLVTRRFRIGGVEYPVDPLSRSLHDLLIPDVGYGQYESAYYQIDGSSAARVGGVITMTLVSFTLASDPG